MHKHEKENIPCDNFREGDGVNPKFDGISASWPNRVANRKALQLCAQVADILNLTLPQLCDEVLHNLYVSAVVPAPDSSQLLVQVTSDGPVTEILEHIRKAHKLLRQEVAMGINRKRVPQLRFNVVSNNSSI